MSLASSRFRYFKCEPCTAGTATTVTLLKAMHHMQLGMRDYLLCLYRCTGRSKGVENTYKSGVERRGHSCLRVNCNDGDEDFAKKETWLWFVNESKFFVGSNIGICIVEPKGFFLTSSRWYKGIYTHVPNKMLSTEGSKKKVLKGYLEKYSFFSIHRFFDQSQIAKKLAIKAMKAIVYSTVCSQRASS